MTELLNLELPDGRFDDDRYLEWLYDENPWGPAYQDNVDEDGVRVSHYALIPQEFRDASGPVPGVFSLNAVTRRGTQRKGHFITSARKIYAEAGADGRRVAIGVPNEKSMTAAVKYMGLRLLGPMPVRIAPVIPRRSSRVDTYDATPEFLDSEHFAELTRDLDDYPTAALTNRWTPEHLRWRLSRPHATYSIHVSPELFAVSTRTEQRGVRAAVIMKLLPRGRRKGPLSPREVIAAACRRHRTPVMVYAGYNEHVKVRGIEPPRRLRPAPLYILVWSPSGDVDQDTIELSTYEFLDIDAF